MKSSEKACVKLSLVLNDYLMKKKKII